MNEKLLQFLWQFQYFNRDKLATDLGEPLSIIKVGQPNKNQGPDFLDASIRIGDVQLVGNIEIHVSASDWYKHHHEHDAHYHNIILHVVWENDLPIKDKYGQLIPTLTLESRVAKTIVQRYETLLKSDGIPCHTSIFPSMSEIAWMAWKERLVAERLERKAANVLELLAQSNNHWEEVFWWMLASNFGVKVNTALFEAVAKSIPITILAKHKHQLIQIEALLMGQANLLEGNLDDVYYKKLQQEYTFIKKKHSLQTITILPNFLRTRPANFPTIRLAQLAMLIHQSAHLFSKIKEQTNVLEVQKLFIVFTSEYWMNHYKFEQSSTKKEKKLGGNAIDNLLINTVIPVLFAYGLYNKEEAIKEKAIGWLSQIKGEKNSLVENWKSYSPPIISSFDSQAMIELTNNYCKQKRCLQCAIGLKIVQSSGR